MREQRQTEIRVLQIILLIHGSTQILTQGVWLKANTVNYLLLFPSFAWTWLSLRWERSSFTAKALAHLFSITILFVLVSYGCYKKIIKNLLIATTQMYHLTIVEVRSLKSLSQVQNLGSISTVFFLEALEENMLLASSSFWRLLIILGLWLHHSDLCLPVHISFSNSDPLPSSHQYPCDVIKPTWIIQCHIPISRY